MPDDAEKGRSGGYSTLVNTGFEIENEALPNSGRCLIMVYIGYHIISLPRYNVLFCHIYMYRTLTDCEAARGLAHGGAVFDNIGGQLTGPLLDISLQDPTLSLSRYATYICEPRREHAETRDKSRIYSAA